MDVRIWNRGASVVMVEPVSDEARAWIDDHVVVEPWQYLGNAFGVDHRMATALEVGMVEAGLEVA